MKRFIAMMLCSVVAAVGLVGAAPSSQAALPLPITITCTGAGCTGVGQIGPILVTTGRLGGDIVTIVCVSHIPGSCDLAGGALVFGKSGLTGIVGAGTAAVLFQVNRYVAGAFVSIGGSYFVEGFVNQFSAVLVALTPFLRKCVVVTGGKILTPVC